MPKANTYRIGTQDKRERFSNRVHLLITQEDVYEPGDFAGPDIFVVMEFNEDGSVYGRDILDTFSEAKLEFDAIVELIRLEEGSDAVYPI